MKDRVAGAPGQYKATITESDLQKMQAGEQFVITMVRDDQPIVEGTPYSKAAVLPDDVAKMICPGVEDPTPAEAFRHLVERANASVAKKTLSVAAGGSATVTLPDSGLFLVSFVDNARRGCVLLQTHQTGFYTESNTLLELGNWAFSTDGLNLTISETGGKWDGTACITALGRKNI